MHQRNKNRQNGVPTEVWGHLLPIAILVILFFLLDSLVR